MVHFAQDSLVSMITNKGNSIAQLSEERHVLLVFLRHFGCTFCREALADLSEVQEDIIELGTQLVFVHMADNQTADAYLERYGLKPHEHVSDPSCQFYKAFGLTKGTPKQLFGLQSWIRGFDAGVIKGLGVGAQLGDGFQMPGIFGVSQKEVRVSFIHKLASDRPVYLDLVKQCCEI